MDPKEAMLQLLREEQRVWVGLHAKLVYKKLLRNRMANLYMLTLAEFPGLPLYHHEYNCDEQSYDMVLLRNGVGHN